MPLALGLVFQREDTPHPLDLEQQAFWKGLKINALGLWASLSPLLLCLFACLLRQSLYETLQHWLREVY